VPRSDVSPAGPVDCDLDHTSPYVSGGPHTRGEPQLLLPQASPLLKTFWTGRRDEQRPDGTIVWPSPSGHTYTTRPSSRLLFPTLSLRTGELPTAPTTSQPQAQRGLMMLTRRQTRAQDRARRIDAERALNAAHVAERNQPPPF
jgi:hypothetical protein